LCQSRQCVGDGGGLSDGQSKFAKCTTTADYHSICIPTMYHHDQLPLLISITNFHTTTTTTH
jgi:hypothetical protein